MQFQAPKEYDYYTKYLNQAAVRKAIHVGSLPFHSRTKVETILESDVMQSVKPWLAEAMDHYKVRIFPLHIVRACTCVCEREKVKR